MINMKKWIVKQLLNCKWLKEALYEALWKEYVEKLQKDFFDLKRDHRTLVEEFNAKLDALTNIQESLMKAFPISDSFDTVISALVKCADVIMPLFPKKDEEPKKKRKYTKKKK